MIESERDPNKTTAATSELEVLYPFQIPIFRWQRSGHNLIEQLRKAILNRYQQSEGLRNSNRGGGWQSSHDLHKWSSPGISGFLQEIEGIAHEIVRYTVDDPQSAHFDNWIIEAWANVNRKGAHNASHDHFSHARKTLWSGIYYVEPGRVPAGDTEKGRTIFEDRIGVPREVVNNGDLFSHEVTIEPQPGLMVAFPATLHHRVERYLGDDQRITIAWNLYHPDFDIPQYDESHAASRTL